MKGSFGIQGGRSSEDGGIAAQRIACDAGFPSGAAPVRDPDPWTGVPPHKTPRAAHPESSPRRDQRAENPYTVSERYTSPGRSTVPGKSGRFGESGKCWVSRAIPAQGANGAERWSAV